MNLLDFFRKALRQQGLMPFVEFMHHALYAPNLGYYNSSSQKFGASGDFVTAPELTPLFGQTLANQCLQVLSALNDPILFEFGAGSGQLCVDILTQLDSQDALPREYHILEVSAHLQARQRALIIEKMPHLQHRIKWLSAWPTTPFEGVMIANEVLDAMPVHRFLQTSDGLMESYITLNSKDELQEVFQPSVNAALIAHVKTILSSHQAPYQSEANLFLDDWFRQSAAILDRGAMFILDYGFPRHEYYHSDRREGTLMCHYRHHAHPFPLLHLGEQDITAHVDFTHVAEAAHAAGFHVAGYTNQASFLLANGLLSLLDQMPDDRLKMNTQQAVKKLLHPSEMGELFKVIALTKPAEWALTGFQLRDLRASL